MGNNRKTETFGRNGDPTERSLQVANGYIFRFEWILFYMESTKEKQIPQCIQVAYVCHFMYGLNQVGIYHWKDPLTFVIC